MAGLPVGVSLDGSAVERGGAEGAVLTAELTTWFLIPAKLGMLAMEQMMLSKVGTPGSAAGVGRAELTAAGLAIVLAASANPGMLVEILSTRLSIGGGAEGAEPPIAAATLAREGMLVEMMSVMLLKVGKTS